MAIPKFEKFFVPVLKYLDEKNIHIARKELRESSIPYFNPTQNELNDMIDSGSSRFLNRADWAITYLKQAELIENIDKGVYQITEFGREFLKENPNFDLKTLKEKTPFLSNRKTKAVIEIKEDTDKNEDTIFDLQKALDEHSEDIKFSILDKLSNLGENTKEKGDLFEEICLDLLTKVLDCSGNKIGKSGDKGVDLILHLDRLGLNSLGVQCKCQQASISAKDINHLRGGLEEHGLDKGIFITTSSFSKDAKDRINSINGTSTNIRMISGLQLADLMMEYEIGVEKSIHYSYNITINE